MDLKIDNSRHYRSG